MLFFVFLQVSNLDLLVGLTVDSHKSLTSSKLSNTNNIEQIDVSAEKQIHDEGKNNEVSDFKGEDGILNL